MDKITKISEYIYTYTWSSFGILYIIKRNILLIIHLVIDFGFTRKILVNKLRYIVLADFLGERTHSNYWLHSLEIRKEQLGVVLQMGLYTWMTLFPKVRTKFWMFLR